MTQIASPPANLRFGRYEVPIEANPDMAKLVRKFSNEIAQLNAKKSDPSEFIKRMVGSFAPLCQQLAEALHVTATVHQGAIADLEGGIQALEEDAGDVTLSEGMILRDALVALIGVAKSVTGASAEDQAKIDRALDIGAKALEIATELATEGEDDEEGDEEEEEDG